VEEEVCHAVGQLFRVKVATGAIPGVHPVDHAKEGERPCTEVWGIAVALTEESLNDLLAAQVVLPLDLRNPGTELSGQNPRLMGDHLHRFDMA